MLYFRVFHIIGVSLLLLVDLQRSLSFFIPFLFPSSQILTCEQFPTTRSTPAFYHLSSSTMSWKDFAIILDDK